MTDRLSFDDLDRVAVDYDEAVLGTEDIDRFCSSTYWVLPSARHLTPSAAPRIFHHDGAWVVLGQTGAWLHPLEVMWGLSSPLVGPDPDATRDLLLRVLSTTERWSGALLTGLVDSSLVWKSLLPSLRRRHSISAGPVTRRYLADLSDGVDGFLRRRSAGFRRNLEKAARRARRRGLSFEIADGVENEDPDESFARILAVERRSWKGLGGVGIETDPMRSFYRDMNRRLIQRRQRRLIFAKIDGEDVAYILGGVFGDVYRGLQFSFDSRFGSLSPGNLCQLEEVRRLAASGIRSYDLGTEVRYKKRWGEAVFSTAAVLVRRST